MICRKCHLEVADGAFCCRCGAKQAVSDRTPKRRGNGQGTAIKRGRTWTGITAGYQYTDADGNTHRKRPTKGGFSTKKDALAWASAATDNTRPLPKLVDLWEGYKDSGFTKLSKNKQTAYKIARRRLESIIQLQIDQITVDDLQSVVNRECKTYYPAKDMRDLMSKLYQRAMASNSNAGRIAQNLASFIVLPDLEEKEATPFNENEIKKLWTYYNNGNIFTGYILLMCYTGMMTGELLKCTKAMVDIDNCEIRGAGIKTKTRQNASIAFPDFMRPVVEKLLRIVSTNSNAKNQKLVSMNTDNFYIAFYDAIDKAGIDNPEVNGRHRLTPYSCRHTYGTEAVKAGFHPEIIKKMLRHSNTRTQEKYTHLGASDVHDAVNKLTAQ